MKRRIQPAAEEGGAFREAPQGRKRERGRQGALVIKEVAIKQEKTLEVEDRFNVTRTSQAKATSM